MQFDECYEGEFRIFVGALDAPRGEGFIAAVVVSRVIGDDRPEERAGEQRGEPTGERGADRSGARGSVEAGSRGGTSPGPRPQAREVWRDDSLACGYRWPTPEAALLYAKNRAREMVRKASPMLHSPAA